MLHFLFSLVMSYWSLLGSNNTLTRLVVNFYFFCEWRIRPGDYYFSTGASYDFLFDNWYLRLSTYQLTFICLTWFCQTLVKNLQQHFAQGFFQKCLAPFSFFFPHFFFPASTNINSGNLM